MSSKRASVDEIQDAIDSFTQGLPEMQKTQFNKVYALLKELSLDADGNIKSTIENLKVIGRVKSELSRLTDNPEYQDKVSDLQDAIDQVDKIQTEYFSNTFSDFTKPKAVTKLQELAADSTVDQLTGAGIQSEVVDHAVEIIQDHITDGSSFSDMVDELKTSMLGDDEADSKLISYSKQTINDTLSGFARNYHAIVTKDLGLQWYTYVGALIDTSRPLCKALVHKKYIHESELSAIARGQVDGVQVSREGMFPGTTGDNFVNNCGGYNCSHQCIPIPTSSVPSSIRRRFDAEVEPDEEELTDQRPKRK